MVPDSFYDPDESEDRADPLTPGLRAAFGAPSVLPREVERPATTMGRYEVIGEIGRGGLGVVLRARDRDIGRDTAMKVLREGREREPGLLRRFIEEAQVAGQLQHPGIVPVYEMGLFGERPFFTMRLVEGRTLSELLRERRDPSQDRVRFLKVFEQVCQALAYAHSRGVIHRDLKPGNVMVGAFGEVQVMDWGLAKVLRREPGPPEGEREGGARPLETARSSSPEHGSTFGAVIGTPQYMPPEQARGEVDSLDERSDVFGLGAILCEVLTGGPPFLAPTGREALEMAAEARLEDASVRLAACGAEPDLIAIARRCLAAKPTARPCHAGDVAREIGAHLAAVEERARAREVEAAEARASAAHERRARRLAVGLAVTVVASVLLAVAGFVFFEADRRARAARTSGAVEAAMDEANLLRGRARSAQPGDLSAWTEAHASAQRARELAASGPVDLALVSRAGDLVAGIEEEMERARRAAEQERKDREMVERLAEIRMARADPGHKRLRVEEAEFARAFREYGIDLDVIEPSRAAALIRDSAISRELAAGLDFWARVRREEREPEESGWRRIARAALEADTDPLRSSLRKASDGNDLDQLRQIAKSQGVWDLPAPTLDLLGVSLGRAGDLPLAISVLRGAQLRHPDDYWINADLGPLLPVMDPHQGEESIRCFNVAVALRPRSAVAWSNLATSFDKADNREAALTACLKAIDLDPDLSSPHGVKGRVLRMKGDLDGAIGEFRKQVQLDSQSFYGHSNLGGALAEKGDLAGGKAELQEAIRLRPDFAAAHSNLGALLLNAGDVDGSIAENREAIRLEKDLVHAHFNLASALDEKGDVDGAIEELRETVRLLPSYAAAHHHLGQLLEEKGDYRAAAVSFRSALTAGVEGTDRDRVEVAARTCEQMAVLDGKLPSIIEGKEPLGTASDRDLVATICFRRRLYSAAARFWKSAFELEPPIADRLLLQHRYFAACSAVMAASGQGGDPPAAPEDRAALRRQALEWLRSDLAARSAPDVGSTASGRAAIRPWPTDSDLAGVRDPAALEALPPGERDAWKAFWADVDRAIAGAVK